MLGSGNTAHYTYPENEYKSVKERKEVFDYTFLVYAVFNTSLVIVIASFFLSTSLFYLFPILVAVLLCSLVLFGVFTKRTGVFYVKYGAMGLVFLGMLALLMMLDRWHVVIILIIAFLDVGLLIRNFLDNAPGGTYNSSRRASQLPQE